MVAVGSRSEAGVVVADVLAQEEPGAVGEDDVVPGEAFLSERPRRDDDEVTGTDAKGDDGAVGLGEDEEGTVDGLLEVVEVADDGERRWAWRVV